MDKVWTGLQKCYQTLFQIGELYGNSQGIPSFPCLPGNAFPSNLQLRLLLIIGSELTLLLRIIIIITCCSSVLIISRRLISDLMEHILVYHIPFRIMNGILVVRVVQLLCTSLIANTYFCTASSVEYHYFTIVPILVKNTESQFIPNSVEITMHLPISRLRVFTEVLQHLTE